MNNLKNELLSSKFSLSGYMGNDKRTVEEIIKEDKELLNKLGINLENIVNALSNSLEKSRAGHGDKVIISNDVFGEFIESRGKIPSPLVPSDTYEKGEAIITNSKIKKSITITAISLHLIKDYGFFQGIGSRFRIDPQTAVSVLEL